MRETASQTEESIAKENQAEAKAQVERPEGKEKEKKDRRRNLYSIFVT